MLLTIKRAVCQLQVLAFFFVAGTFLRLAAQPGELTLDASWKAPLPAQTDVHRIVSTGQGTWFQGFARPRNPAVAVVYRWSQKGLQKLDPPPAEAVIRDMAADGAGTVYLATS